MVLDAILISVTIIALLIASYTDLKVREVPDWLSYGLIFAALGIRSIFAINCSTDIFISGLLGLAVCMGLAYLLYYTHQWGGGDSKQLMAMGAVIGIQFPFNNGSFTVLWFFLAMLFLGAIYGIFWMFYLALKRRSVFWPKLKETLGEYKNVQWFLLAFTFVLTIIGFWYHFAFLGIFPAVIFYLIIFVNTVEDSCFLRQTKPKDLTEGDWLAEDVVIKKKSVMPKKTLDYQDLKTLRALHRQGKINTVLIKEGIPFVPSFLFAYLTILFIKDFSVLLMGMI